MTEYRKDGYWWLPEASGKRVAGSIVYGNGVKQELKLLGSLQDEMEALRSMGQWGDSYSPEIILGLTADGKSLTLYNCLRAGGQLSTNSFMTEAYLPRLVLEGRHFLAAEDIVFQHMTMRLAHLGEWYQKTGRQMKIEDTETGSQKLTLVHKSPTPDTIMCGQEEIELGLDSNIKFARFGGDFVVSERACCSVSPKSPAHIIQFLEEYLPPLIDLFSLGIGRSVSVLELRGKAAEDCAEGSAESVKRAPTIKICWEDAQNLTEQEELIPDYMVFVRSDIEGSVENIFDQWLTAYREIKPAMQLFFGEVLRCRSYSCTSFLNAVRAAEAYHRYRRSNGRSRITLKQLLEELLAERAALFEFEPSQYIDTAYRIKEIRRYFTHYHCKKDPDFASGDDFYVYTELLKWTILACLLEEAGIERTHAHELIARNQTFLFFKEVNLKKRKAEVMTVESVQPEDVPTTDATDKKDIPSGDSDSDEGGIIASNGS